MRFKIRKNVKNQRGVDCTLSVRPQAFKGVFKIVIYCFCEALIILFTIDHVEQN